MENRVLFANVFSCIDKYMGNRVVLAKQYLVGKTIGKGGYGKVKIGEYIPTRQTVAIKILNRLKIETTPNMLQNVKREISIGMWLDHPHVIHVYDVKETQENIYMIMEYAGGGDLFDYVARRGRLLENESRHVFRQIIAGVEYCHAKTVVHRDLKLENFVLDTQGNVKIADFGLSKMIAGGNDLLKTACGSPNYAAPELLSLSRVKATYAGIGVDIWSCGVILYALLCGVLPFDDENTGNLFKKIKRGKYKVPKHLALDACDLIRRILTVNPTKRITIAEIRQHHWFRAH